MAKLNRSFFTGDSGRRRRVTQHRVLIVVAVLLALILIPVALVDLGGNLLKGPISRMVQARTGRSLTIDGTLRLRLGLTHLGVQADHISFGNPPWAKQAQMVTADRVAFALNIWPLLRKRVSLDQVSLDQAQISLEQNAEGKKNWLLDQEQKDENTRVQLGRLLLKNARIDYDKADEQTSLHAEVSTDPVEGKAAPDISYDVKGRYKGVPVTARGGGGPALALREQRTPYPFKTEATIGRTALKAEGTITDFSDLAAVDFHLDIRGQNMADLFPVLGVALPETPEYRTAGHLTHGPHRWRYDDFTLHLGSSDLAGTVEVDTGGPRPAVSGNLEMRSLNIADLGPMIGTRHGGPAEEKPEQASDKVLPDIPFRAERWNTVDVDLKLSAKEILREKGLPIENLSTHLQLKDAVLKLDPLKFGIAGGTLSGSLSMDGREKPILTRAAVKANKLVLHRLMPALKNKAQSGQLRANFGRVDGNVELTGRGNSVAQMLGNADGKFGVVVNGGQISRLMMEAVGLHVLEIVTLKFAGDQVVNIRCGVGDFGVKDGVMKANALVFDTQVTNVQGAGHIDFGHERLDLTLVPNTKETAVASLRSPIYLRGSFAKPDVQVDTRTLAAKGLAALGLGLANPLLALVPLVESGPGMDSDCGKLINQTLDKPKEDKGTE